MKNSILAIILVMLFGIVDCRADYIPTVDEDKIWEYCFVEICKDIFQEPYPDMWKRMTFVRYKFDGTVEKYGKTYHIWKSLDYDVYAMYYTPDVEGWISGFFQFDWEPLDWEYEGHHTREENLALVREEDKKVYLLLEKDMYIYNPDYKNSKDPVTIPYEATEGEEALLYDFSLTVGDSYTGIQKMNTLSTMYILYDEEPSLPLTHRYLSMVSQEAYANEYHNDEFPSALLNPRLHMNYLVAFEGFGVLKYGTLVDFDEYASSFDYRRENKQIYLNNVYNREGEIIHKGKDWHPPVAGIKATQLAPVGDSRIFDLFGREVRNPQPGTLYIKNGKKFIAK